MRQPIVIIAALPLALPATASAQDAAETAVILSTVSPGQGAAARSMGNSISGALGSASGAIASTRAQASPASGAVQVQQVRRAPVRPTDSDPLEGTDAAQYRLASGATIRVSGGMRPSAGTRCIENCEAPAEDTEGGEQEEETAPAETGTDSEETPPSD